MPGERERRTGLRLRFNYRGRGPSLLVAEGRLNTKGRAVASQSKTGRGVVTGPIFLLVPQVKLPKRLDLARDAERVADGVPGLIVTKWVEGNLRRSRSLRSCPEPQLTACCEVCPFTAGMAVDLTRPDHPRTEVPLDL
jgi:Family of unknown function (DUF6441)